MRLLFGLTPADGWARAARNLGHEGFLLSPERVFDDFHRAQPDVVFVESGALSSRGRSPLGECLKRYDSCRLVVHYQPGRECHPPRDIDLVLTDQPGMNSLRLRPAADCPPDFPGGQVRPEFACGVALVGSYKPEYRPWLERLTTYGIRFRVFGPERWPVAQYLGHLAPHELPDLYRTATITLDLDGNPGRVLVVWASGGYSVSVGRWADSGVGGLDYCPHVENPTVLRNLVAAGRLPGVEFFGLATRENDTLTHRLQEILCSFTPKTT